MPYLNLGLGASWDHTSQTALVPDQVEPDIILNTRSKTNTAWAYSIGAGLGFIVTTNFWLSFRLFL